MTIAQLLASIDTQLVALELAAALRRADHERAEARARARWQRHYDVLRVSASDWAVFIRSQYRLAWRPAREAVYA